MRDGGQKDLRDEQQELTRELREFAGRSPILDAALVKRGEQKSDTRNTRRKWEYPIFLVAEKEICFMMSPLSQEWEPLGLLIQSPL
tara:strand:- start:63 stop:320 length:258 start_codon:yes stop_codon:yes gene_type:complete